MEVLYLFVPRRLHPSFYTLHPSWVEATAYPLSFSIFFHSDFIAKTQNPFVIDSCFEDFMVSSLVDFVDGGRDKMLLCPNRAVKSRDKMLHWTSRAIKRYLSRMEQFRPDCSDLFISMTKRKKQGSWNTCSVWIDVYQLFTDGDCRAVRAKAHKV